MKKRKLLVGILTSSMTLTAVAGAVCAEDVPLGELFPDEAFRSYCETFDTDGDGCLSTDEAEQVTSITIEEDLGIGSLEGVGGPAAFWGPQGEPASLGELLEGVWGLEGPRGALGAAKPGRKPSPGHARSGAHPNSPRRKE